MDAAASALIYGLEPGPESSPERALWLAVIFAALADACAPTVGKYQGSGRTDVERMAAQAWFDINSRDFHEVCSLAGVEPEAVISVFNKKVQSPKRMKRAA